jgi:hypothetical protein
MLTDTGKWLLETVGVPYEGSFVPQVIRSSFALRSSPGEWAGLALAEEH